MALVANARMYAITPASAAAWTQLFAWVADKSGVPLDLVPHAFPAPLNDLWARPDLGATFICGYPYALGGKRQQILAAPVPSPARYAGRPVYMTDFVVAADGPFHSLEDTFGHRIGYTVEDSQSGCNAPRHHLLRYRSAERPQLYAASIGPLYTPRKVIDAVLAGEIDVGPVDGYNLDILRRHEPDLVARLRIVATTDPAPAPLLVAGPDCTPQVAAALRQALLQVGTAPETAAVRDALCLSHFTMMTPGDYDLTLAWDRDAAAAGYALPG